MVWRVRRRSTFEALRSPERRHRSGSLSVAFVSREELDARRPPPRATPPEPRAEVALAVPRKVGNAVERNRLKRRLRSEIERQEERLAPGAYLISASPAAAGLGTGELRINVEDALRPFGKNGNE